MLVVKIYNYILIADNDEEQKYLKVLVTFLGTNKEDKNEDKYKTHYIHALSVFTRKSLIQSEDQNCTNFTLDEIKNCGIHKCHVEEWRKRPN